MLERQKLRKQRHRMKSGIEETDGATDGAYT